MRRIRSSDTYMCWQMQKQQQLLLQQQRSTCVEPCAVRGAVTLPEPTSRDTQLYLVVSGLAPLFTSHGEGLIG